MRKILPLIFILLSSYILISCSDPEGAEIKGDKGVKAIPGTLAADLPLKWETGKYGGTWRDTYTEDPKSYNPFSNLDGSYLTVTSLILDYLFDYDPYDKEWKGNIVEKFTVAADEEKDSMELICTLRNNIFWSDGVQMTSDDVVWWFNYIESDPEIDPVGSQGRSIRMKDGSMKEYMIEKIDKLSFKYIFPRIVGNPLLVVNTGSIIPKHIWEPVYKKGKDSIREFWGIDTPAEELVGNGPFLLEKNIPGERLIFKRNPNYWMKDERGNSLPYIDRIVLTQIPDSNAEILKFQKGEIEAYPLRGQDLATLLPDSGKGNYSVWNGGLATGYPAIIFNHNPDTLPGYKYRMFTDKNFKKGISCLIDRETIINQVINGLAEPLFHIISESNRYYNSSLASDCSYNPERAAEFFKKAGLEDRNSDGMLEDSNGNNIKFDIITSSSDPILHDYINIMITDFKKSGLDANLVVVDRNLIVQKLLNTGDWECYLAGFSFPRFPEQWYNIWKSSGNLHYWNPGQEKPNLEWEKIIDENYEELIYTFNEEKIKKYYDEFQRILIDEMIITPIFRKYTFMAVRNDWGNINWGYGYSIGDSYRRIYLKEQ